MNCSASPKFAVPSTEGGKTVIRVPRSFLCSPLRYEIDDKTGHVVTHFWKPMSFSGHNEETVDFHRHEETSRSDKQAASMLYELMSGWIFELNRIVSKGTGLQEDLVAWAYERNGLYSVRSCYRMLKFESDQQEAFKLNEAEPSEDKSWWKKVWKLNVPPKVRIFWWRVLHNFLPSKAELKRRHVSREDHCECCGEPAESIFHVAISCTMAICFWQEVKDLIGCKLPHLHPGSWAKDLLSGKFCSLDEAALFICGAWALWSGRNAHRHGKTRWSPLSAAKHMATMVEDLICLNHKRPQEKIQRKSKWKKPEEGWKKVNTDAAFTQETFSGSGGAIIRDENGRILGATAKFYEHVPDVVTAEALAARDGLLLARAGGFEKVILELNNLSLVNFLRSAAGERSLIAGVWHEIKDLSRCFSCFDISFVNREGNEAAHFCAKLASAISPVGVWHEAFPSGLVGIADSDCNSALE